MIFDPPSGWRYGFPRVIPKDCTSLAQWLKECGYPEELMELAEKHSRLILHEDETIEDFKKCHW